MNGILSGKRIKEFLSTHPNARMIFYKQTVVIQIVLSSLVLGAMYFNQDSIGIIGLSFVREIVPVIGMLAVCFLGWGLLWIYRFNAENLKKGMIRDAAVMFLFPTSLKEYRWSIGVSFAAGICEEIVYRGFLYWQLTYYMPIIPALFLTNLVFGLSHYATGPKNSSLAFALGVAFSLIFLYTKSLIVLMIIHVLVDVFSMTRGLRYSELASSENATLEEE
ncbi:MAG: CPBP family intramembrane glutamic endopeptidase [Bacteroidota bacterium]